MLNIATPYLVFLGDTVNPLDAKTGRGLVDWSPDKCIGQLRLPGCRVDLGLPDMTPAEAAAAGAKSLVIGIASTGGQIHADWLATFQEAMDAGLDIVSGMHTKLATVGNLADHAQAKGRKLVDVRVPPQVPVGSGKRRTGKRLLTVGTDCCVGKKYTALSIHAELARRGIDATFRATGQTGIMIAGEGMPIDAVVSDFVSGAAETLSPDNDASHWDVIEGQGSLFHPAYAAVTLGLLHGSQPDALVLCHEAGRPHIDEYPDYPIPDFATCMTHYISAARLTNPDARFVGVSVNTAGLDEKGRQDYLARVAAEVKLPAVDPMAGGVGPIIDHLLKE